MTLIKVFQASYLKVRIYDSRQTLGKEAAYEAGFTIKRLLRRQEEINIIFAAAPSQDNFLEEFAKIDSIPWKKINAFHMDEYLGLEAGAPQSFNSYLNKKIFGKVAFKSVNYIDGNAADVQGECRRYSDLLIKFPPDIIIMGIGENGHIAFNDPEAADFHDPEKVKVVELDERCRMQQVHDGAFPHIEEVPTRAISLTIPALMAARYIFCVVPGPRKAGAIYTTLTGKISESCPASILRTHPNTILYLDQESGRRIMSSEEDQKS